MYIKVPLLKEQTGLGDVVKAATSAIGIKPCTPCQERARRLNRAVQLVPAAQWTDPPAVPTGWHEIRRHALADKEIAMFVRGGEVIIWEIAGGRYCKSYGFCCAILRWKAEEKWSELCGADA